MRVQAPRNGQLRTRCWAGQSGSGRGRRCHWLWLRCCRACDQSQQGAGMVQVCLQGQYKVLRRPVPQQSQVLFSGSLHGAHTRQACSWDLPGTQHQQDQQNCSSDKVYGCCEGLGQGARVLELKLYCLSSTAHVADFNRTRPAQYPSVPNRLFANGHTVPPTHSWPSWRRAVRQGTR